MANMKAPWGLVLKVSGEGDDWCCVEVEELIICLLMVLNPIEAKMMMRRMMRTSETRPPVAVVYSDDPLYLRS